MAGRGKWKPTAASRDEAREKVARALEAIEAGVREITSGDDWKKMLRQLAKFHHYSFGNTMLITSQRPDASRVAGYNTWKDLGRQVRKGEKGIMILAPRIFKREGTNPETGETETMKGVYFRAVHVFDISQTDGEPLAIESVIKPLEGQSDTADQAVAVMGEWLTGHGIPVVQEEMAASQGGYYNWKEGKIALNPQRGPLHQMKTLVHETAHMLLHTPQEQRKIDFQHKSARNIKELTTEIKEVEAESTAYVVLSALGIDSAPYSFGYVANWSGGEPKTVSAVATRVREVADFILTTVLGVGTPGEESETGGEAAAGASAAEVSDEDSDDGVTVPAFYGYRPDPAIYAIETGLWDAGE